MRTAYENQRPVTRYVLDPNQKEVIDGDLLTLGVKTLEACLDSVDRRSLLMGRVWKHGAEIANPRGSHLRRIHCGVTMSQTMTTTNLTVNRGDANDLVFRFEHHEDDPERAVAINQDVTTSLESIRRHQKAIEELTRQMALDDDIPQPSDAMMTTTRAFALAEAMDQSHGEDRVWYAAPWRFGRAKLSRHANREAIRSRPRWWRHGNVTTIREVATQGKSGRTFILGPLVIQSPEGMGAIDQMRLLNIAKNSR